MDWIQRRKVGWIGFRGEEWDELGLQEKSRMDRGQRRMVGWIGFREKICTSEIKTRGAPRLQSRTSKKKALGAPRSQIRTSKIKTKGAIRSQSCTSVIKFIMSFKHSST